MIHSPLIGGWLGKRGTRCSLPVPQQEPFLTQKLLALHASMLTAFCFAGYARNAGWFGDRRTTTAIHALHLLVVQVLQGNFLEG
jgi:hypothetical protein